ncbi:MAG: helix-turn-helix transcriptional regulator [Prevotella shahii]|jgi:hypothetical protein|uniref:DNA-binding XRE family transcriptional regulator n=1 Tax=Hoylesella shahii DSM 15611 = JCM 12083 TaxID=1122991 RepID=A0A318HW94_9BACT|nr:helix-turn-helix transcriptional regulator [Hoylesella shahii]MBF1569010.1 helix-turn-helix transcriptional regulator [Hoylesella shahii]MBF1591443.1 helix-turn-helix transcriptional regulator [Hoylesella shahii]PXX20900.1 DNA-binding XRE family transcriptional regulator [Hoylesella shahii DSM 15611 = JCM 12083]
MKDRIKKVMESQHMSQQTFAHSIGMSPASLSSIFNGRTKPTLNIVEAIKDKIPRISTDWLIFGKGDMYLSDSGHSNNTTNTQPNVISEPVLNFDDLENNSSLFNEQTIVTPTMDYTPQKPERVEVKVIEKPQRKVTEIRIFYDDRTWESFYPEDRESSI